jgi:DNA polymerase-1
MTTLPVLRRLLIPDPGHTLLDLDLTAADAQVVAWEADDEDLKARFRSGEDIHLSNSRELWGSHVQADTTDHRGVKLRDKAKLVHGINYRCRYRTLAEHMQEPQSAAKAFIAHWLGRHPRIRAWHRRTEHQLLTTREVRNIWGFRRIYTDRPDTLLPQALAWIGQSTVAVTINKIAEAIDDAEQREGLPCFILLQDHDNLVCQIPTTELSSVLPVVQRLSRIAIPFPDPLTIPAEFKLSDKSWADVAPVALDTSPTGSLSTAA